MECTFCKIAAGEVQALKAYEDGTCVAFFEINPSTQGHLVIVTKNHYESLKDVSAQEFLNAWSVARFLVQALEEEFHPKGYNALLSVGEVSNQQTKHFSIHVIPLQGGEEAYFGWKPVKLDQEKAKTLILKIEERLKKQMAETKEQMSKHASEVIKVVKMPERRKP